MICHDLPCTLLVSSHTSNRLSFSNKVCYHFIAREPRGVCVTLPRPQCSTSVSVPILPLLVLVYLKSMIV